MLQATDLDTFFDLLADMPDIEAIDEIDIRILAIYRERIGLRGVKGRHEDLERLTIEEDRCRMLRHKLVYRMERRKWSKAVRAVFGDEGFERCLEWIRLSCDDEVKDIALSHSRARTKRGES